MVPPGSVNCTLGLTITYLEASLLAVNNASNPPILSVISLFPNAILSTISWETVYKAHPPVFKDWSWGSVQPKQYIYNVVINTEYCPPAIPSGVDGHAQFVVKERDPNAGADLFFFNFPAGGELYSGNAGFWLSYDC
jgi:hypothetical protein